MRQRLHKALYLGLQSARGRPVGKLTRRLREWDALDAQTYRELSAQRLRAMLVYARHNVPLYSSGPWAEARHGVDPGELRHWPVLDRRALLHEKGRLTAKWRRMLVLTRKSSASTGTPVRVMWNPVAMAWSWAAEYHPMCWHGLDIGEKTLRLWGASGTSLRRTVENWVLNRHFVSAHALTPASLDGALRYLERQQPRLIWGTPSALLQLARHAARKPATERGYLPPPGAVRYAKVGGEQVYAFQREEIESHLGARVIESYGSTEMGPIAAECPVGSMHVLTANVHLEVFRDGQPVPFGELGDIVATTLVNRGMPLIRCRIGDSGRLSPDPCSCGLPQPVLAELRGRSADVLLAADGRIVHGSVLGEALLRYVGRPPLGEVQQIQFEQIDRRHWHIQIESHAELDKRALERQLEELVRDTFGAQCRVDISIVPRIPRETSGKYRYYRTRAGMQRAEDAERSDAARASSASHRPEADVSRLPEAAPRLTPDHG